MRSAKRSASGVTGWLSVAEITFGRNVVKAVLLDVEFYNEAERDDSLNKQAALVVVLANGLAGIGSAVATDGNLAVGAAVGVVAGIVGWLIWSGVSLLVGTKAFGGSADFGEMLRVIGFSTAPLAIGVVPWLGFVGAVWALAAAVIGIREGLDFTTAKAVGTMIAGWAIWLLLSIVVQVVVGLDLRVIWPL